MTDTDLCECDRPDFADDPHRHKWEPACVYWIALAAARAELADRDRRHAAVAALAEKWERLGSDLSGKLQPPMSLLTAAHHVQRALGDPDSTLAEVKAAAWDEGWGAAMDEAHPDALDEVERELNAEYRIHRPPLSRVQRIVRALRTQDGEQ